MKARSKLVFACFFWINTGVWFMVADEIQAIPYYGSYNFPLFGEMPKFGGYWNSSPKIGAWDITMILMMFFSIGSGVFLNSLWNMFRSWDK